MNCIQEELLQLKLENNFIGEVDCSEEENEKFRQLKAQNAPLPAGVLERKSHGKPTGKFYIAYGEIKLTDEEKREYLYHKLLEGTAHIAKMKSYMKFFVVLIIISLILAFINLIIPS